MTDSIVKVEVLLPNGEMDISCECCMNLSFSLHLKVIGVSPSVAVHITWMNWPECAGLSSKLNGVILGRTAGNAS